MQETMQQITPVEFAALMKVLTGILGLIGTFIIMGVVGIFKMNAKLSKIETFNEVQKLKNEHYEEKHAELKQMILSKHH